MSQTFAAIPSRNNSNDILAEWFNLLRLAGTFLEGYLGTGYLSETLFTIANNQATANVTGLVFDHTVNSSAKIDFEIHRTTGSGELMAWGQLFAVYRTDLGWVLIGPNYSGDEPNVTWTITAAGQVQYATDNMAGAGYVGKMKFKAIVCAT